MASTKEILGTYSPEDVVVILSNDKFSHIMSGFAEDTFIQVERTVPHATLVNGADGTNLRIVRAVKNCEVTVTLHQSGESNDVLSQLLILDEGSRDGSDCFSITIKDNTGRTVMSSPQAFIGTNPTISFSEGAENRDWVLQAIHMDIFSGGNARFSPEGFSSVSDLGYISDDRWAPSSN